MAQQTKSTRSRSSRGGSRSTRSRNGGQPRSRNGARSGARKPRSSASRSSSNAAKSTGAISTVGEVAKKAKVPAIAAGAGLAGLAGGVALAGRKSGQKVLGVRMPSRSGAETVSRNLAETAKNVGSFGERVGSLASEIRHVREAVAEDGRSPIEVVLQGLTRR